MSRLSAASGVSQAVIDALDFKASVRAATTAPVVLANLIPGFNLDGEVLVGGDRVLVKDNGNFENGIWVIQSAGPPVRATDANQDQDVTAGLVVVVTEGTTNGDTGWILVTDDPITVGVTTLTFMKVFPLAGGGGTTDALAIADKGITANATTSDEDAAMAGGISITPVANGMVLVFVNGLGVEVGDGVKTKECYFADPATPSVPRAIANIQAGDSLRWMGSVATYELAPTDKIDLVYVV